MAEFTIDGFTPLLTTFDPAADYILVEAGGTTTRGMLGQYLFARNLAGSGFLASATDVIFGRSSVGAGAVQEITCTSFIRTVLDDATASAARSTLGAAVSGANNDITSMTALTGALQAPTQINDANGNEVLKFSSVPSAANEVTIENSAGVNVIVKATGSYGDVSLNLEQKGNASLYLGTASCIGLRLVADQPILDSSGNEYLKFSKTASAVNEFTITNAATGNGPILSATGSDTNIDIFITPKGTGKTKFATGINMGTVINSIANDTAYLQFIDAGAAAINYIQIGNATSGNNPKIIGGGGSADVTLELNSQGAGHIYLNPGSGDIKWGKALVALGGGAAPTLGTIGGSGPATAGQNSWLRIRDSAGAACWVPVWK